MFPILMIPFLAIWLFLHVVTAGIFGVLEHNDRFNGSFPFEDSMEWDMSDSSGYSESSEYVDEMLSEDLLSCREVAESMLMDSWIWGELEEENSSFAPLSFMEESSDEVFLTYDYRIYGENEYGDMITVDRIRFDFQNKTLFRYDPALREYEEVPNLLLLQFPECLP